MLFVLLYRKVGYAVLLLGSILLDENQHLTTNYELKMRCHPIGIVFVSEKLDSATFSNGEFNATPYVCASGCTA